MPQNLWILTSYDYNILLVDWCSPRITAVILHIHFFTVKSHLSSFVITLNCKIILRAKVCVYFWPYNVFSLDLRQSNQIRESLICWPSSAAVTWHGSSSSADICLHDSCPQAPPTASQHGRKLSLVVSGQGGWASGAGETQASFIQHSQPLCWP